MQEDEIILSQQYCCVSWVDPVPIEDQQDAHKLFCFFKDRVETLDNLTYEKVLDDYRDFKDMYYKEIGGEFECAVPYVKIRGAYKTQDMCVARIKQLETKYKETEPVAIYCGMVGKWFPFLGSQEASNDPALPMLMNRALWDYQEYIKENDHEFNEYHKKIENTYERIPFDPNHDYLTEDKPIEKFQFFCVSCFEPTLDTAKQVREAYLKKFIYFFLSEEFKARYSSKGVNEIPDFEQTEDSLWSAFTKSTFEDKQFERIGWKCLKLRGIYASEAEAQKRAELLQKIDKDYRVDVCRVGGWLPFHPPGHLLKSHYADEELDDIMGGLKQDVDQEVMQNLKELQQKQQNDKAEDKAEDETIVL